MGKPLIKEIVTESLSEHPAVKAWCQLERARIEPGRIDVLKDKRKSAVYRLHGVGPGGTAVIAKKCSVATAQVERLIYSEFLPRVPASTLQYYGSLEEPAGKFCWLFLEEARGARYWPQRDAHRVLAGRWLGTIHLASLSDELRACLPDRGMDQYLGLLRSCRATFRQHLDNPELPADDVSLLRTLIEEFDGLEAHWGEVAGICEVVSPTVVHGDFVPKNIRVRHSPTGPSLLVFDWEMAGWGVSAGDLAHSVSHAVSPDVDAYCSVLKRDFAHVDVRNIRRVADCGNILRVLDEISWVTIFLADRPYIYMSKGIAYLRAYERKLTTDLRTMNWN